MRQVIEAVNETLALNYAKTSPACGVAVRRNRKGRGVYATHGFKKGDVVERAPVLVMPARQLGSVLEHYVYEWSRGNVAIAMGVGSMFNHAIDPNVTFTYNPARKQEIQYRARRPIRKGEELTIHYRGEPGTDPDLGFTVKK